MESRRGNVLRLPYGVFDLQGIFYRVGDTAQRLLNEQITGIENECAPVGEIEPIEKIEIVFREGCMAQNLADCLPNYPFEVNRLESFVMRYATCVGLNVEKYIPIFAVEERCARTRGLAFHQIDFFHNVNIRDFESIPVHELIYDGTDIEGIDKDCINKRIRRRSIYKVISKARAEKLDEERFGGKLEGAYVADFFNARGNYV